MSQIKQIVNSRQSLLDWGDELAEFWLENKYITVSAHSKRTLDQNAGIRVCYTQIRQRTEDSTPIQIERECKLRYGVPILREDPVHNYVFTNTIDKLDYERKLKVMDTLCVTSIMNPSQASLMIKAMKEDHPYISLEK